MEERREKGKMTVAEAGRKGGQKVKRLIAEGERSAGGKMREGGRKQ